MTALLALVVVAPILGAMITLSLRLPAIRRRVDDRVSDGVVVVILAATVVASAVLLAHVTSSGTVVLGVGGWSPELGIVLVADRFAALVLLIAVSTIFVVELYSIGQRSTPWAAYPEVARPMMLVLTSGVSLAIVTGDLFTLFVAFELILVSSYVLLTHQGKREQIRTGMTYVVLNLWASTLFLFGVAYVYASTGTVNMALLAERMPGLSDGVRLGIGLWFLVVFGSKAALFPLFSWLPDSYPTAPTSITAVFAGLLTKVGVYVMIRFMTLNDLGDLRPLLLTLAGVTMIVGVAGALAQDDVKRILSFHIISQIGYMMMGLGMFTVAGVAGAILFLVHQIPIKTVMFLVGGLIERDQGTSSLPKISGLIARKPLIAALFAVSALSLAGLPPFSGFVAKLALIDAGIDTQAIAIVAVALAGSLLTLLSMTKIWLGVFWGKPDDTPPPADDGRGLSLMTWATVVAVVGTLAIAVWAGPLWSVSEQAARELLEREPYIAEVLGR